MRKGSVNLKTKQIIFTKPYVAELLDAECLSPKEHEVTVSLECPFCYHKVGRIFQGEHGAIECKCDNCGEIFIFPPVTFSRNTCNACE